jgi:hypothetical protein
MDPDFHNLFSYGLKCWYTVKVLMPIFVVWGNFLCSYTKKFVFSSLVKIIISRVFFIFRWVLHLVLLYRGILKFQKWKYFHGNHSRQTWKCYLKQMWKQSEQLHFIICFIYIFIGHNWNKCTTNCLLISKRVILHTTLKRLIGKNKIIFFSEAY